MEIKFKEAKTTVEILPLKQECIIKGTGKHSILTLSNKEYDKDTKFTWELVAYGEQAVTTDCPLEIGHKVILSKSPERIVELPSNSQSFAKQAEFFSELGKTDREALQKNIMTNSTVDIIVYFFIASYEISGIKIDDKK